MVHDYNKYMGGVDLKDQKMSMYLLERKRGIISTWEALILKIKTPDKVVHKNIPMMTPIVNAEPDSLQAYYTE